jgi:gamma-glutamylputrescine oxidase
VNTYWLASLGMDPFAPPAALPAEVDAVVVGGGLMGVAAAYWLARAGSSVVLVEADGLASGATGRNAGLMLPNSSGLEDPRPLQQVLADEGIDAGYATVGHLALASSEACWESFQGEAAQSRERGGTLQALDVKACEDLLGMRLSSSFLGGRWFVRGSVVHSGRLVYGLAHAAERRGATIAVQTRAVEVAAAPGDRLVVATTRGRVHTAHVIYACNYKTPALLPELAAVLQPSVAQVLSTAPLPPLFRMGLGVDWGSVYWRQTPDGAIILGGGSQPLKEDGDTGDGLDPGTQSRLEGFLSRAFPGFPELTVTRRWTGVMDSARDGRPLVGPLARDPRRWVVAGFGGHGMPAGLNVGRAIVGAIATGVVPESLAPLSPSRFAELR